MKLLYFFPLIVYLSVLSNPNQFDIFVNEFSPKDYIVVSKFHQLPARFRHSLHDLRKLKFIKSENYNPTDFNDRLWINNDRRRGRIYFAYSDNSAIIYYLHGGRAAHYHLYIIGTDKNKKIWHKNTLPIRHKNLIELQQILKNTDYTEAMEDVI